MTSGNALVLVPGSCETVAGASVVCTGTTGTLVRNIASVVAGSINIHAELAARGVVRLPSGRYQLFLKGVSEILTKKCTCHVVVSKNPDHSQHADSEIETKAIDETTKDNISRTITFYVNQMLRTITFCYRDFESWPPPGTHFLSPDEVSHEDLPRDMTLVAITGIEDPLRPGVREAVATCHHAGVTIKMCTGGNVLIVRPIATQCGTYSTEGSPRRAPLSALSTHPRVTMPSSVSGSWSGLPLRIRGSPLKHHSPAETASVPRDGVNDDPAPKAASVVFSITDGYHWYRGYKEASGTIFMDGGFVSTAVSTVQPPYIKWGPVCQRRR